MLGLYTRPSNSVLQSVQGVRATDLFKVNGASPNPKTSPSAKAPMKSLSVDAAELGTAYVLNTPPSTAENPVSVCVGVWESERVWV
jgi:hypothetical protein